MNFSFFAKNVYGRQNEQIEMPNCCFVSLVIAYSFLDGGGKAEVVGLRSREEWGLSFSRKGKMSME